jgi:hypothetical protein
LPYCSKDSSAIWDLPLKQKDERKTVDRSLVTEGFQLPVCLGADAIREVINDSIASLSDR